MIEGNHRQSRGIERMEEIPQNVQKKRIKLRDRMWLVENSRRGVS